MHSGVLVETFSPPVPANIIDVMQTSSNGSERLIVVKIPFPTGMVFACIENARTRLALLDASKPCFSRSPPVDFSIFTTIFMKK